MVQSSQIAARRGGRQHTDLWLTPFYPGKRNVALPFAAIWTNCPQLKAYPNHAEGNRFYIEELIRSLDDGVIVWDKERGRCETACDTTEIPIPNTPLWRADVAY